MEQNRNEGNVIGLGAEMAREGYEASIVERMAGRAGAYSPKGAAGNASVASGIGDVVWNIGYGVSSFFDRLFC